MCHSWSAQCTLQETVRYGGPGEPHTFEACNPEGDAEFSVAATPMRCRVLVHPRLVASGNPFTVLEPSGYPTMITRSWDARKGKVRPLVDWLLEPFRATSLLTAFGIMKETLTVFSDSPGRPSLPLFVVGRVTNHDPEATNEGVH